MTLHAALWIALLMWLVYLYGKRKYKEGINESSRMFVTTLEKAFHAREYKGWEGFLDEMSGQIKNVTQEDLE